jgi:ferrous iron transport protein B
VGGVIVFLPNILLLFLAIAVLEDTGYMARGAFIMDRFMHRIGLHGKSFVPMLIGFGCSVPAIMATRTLESRRDRLTTMMVIPLISCGARLPIYALIIPAFFPSRWHGPMLWAIYVIGIAMAIGAARLLRATLFRGPSTPFVMELPPYRMPPLRSVLTHMWQRGWLYLRKAGTIILAVSIIMWFITSYPKKYGPASDHAVSAPQRGQMTVSPTQASGPAEHSTRSEQLAYSIAGRVGHAIEPALKLMGFDWRIGTALIGAFAAKEVFVAQMGIVYSLGEVDQTSAALRDKLQANYSPLTGFCIMLFCLIGAPCMATVAVTRSESGSWGWALLQWGGLTLLAFIVTTMVYQVGRLAAIGVG